MSIMALEGLRPWILQRLSALYMVVYSLYFVIYWALFESFTYENWYDWLVADINQVLLVLFYFSLFVHAWVGIRDVLLDYIKPVVLRLILLFAVAVFLLGSAAWLLKILIVVNV